MRHGLARLLVTLTVFLTQVAFAESVGVNSLRMWNAPDHTRLVLDLSDATQHRISPLQQPERLLIDLKNARLAGKVPREIEDNPYIQQIRYGMFSKEILRVVLDLKSPVQVKSFMLKPGGGYGHRLVLDIYDKQGAPLITKPAAPAPRQLDEITIAIDAGHGGEDYGASGPRKTHEKHVVLGIARELEKIIARQKGVRPILTRKGDYYISLRERTRLARDAGADLFVSIHADAFKRSSARGASVYAVSYRGATSEMARWLADSENASDLAGGVSIRDKDDDTRKTILDLSKDKSTEFSLKLGRYVLNEMGGFAKLHNSSVQQAGFVVLKSPDIPSILVETGFISNPHEEKKLRSKSYQKRMAQAIYDGIEKFLHKERHTFLRPGEMAALE